MSDSSPTNVTELAPVGFGPVRACFFIAATSAACLSTASLRGHLLEILTWLLACTLHSLTMILFKN